MALELLWGLAFLGQQAKTVKEPQGHHRLVPIWDPKVGIKVGIKAMAQKILSLFSACGSSKPWEVLKY